MSSAHWADFLPQLLRLLSGLKAQPKCWMSQLCSVCPGWGAKDLMEKTAGKLQGSRFSAAANQSTCSEPELAPNPTLPSQGSQWGTRTAAAFIIQGHPVTQREHEMLRLSWVLLSPHLCPAVRGFSYSQIVALVSSKDSLATHR